jgi:hypothetical protein
MQNNVLNSVNIYKLIKEQKYFSNANCMMLHTSQHVSCSHGGK